MGHTPFGHVGEDALDECLRGRFDHGFRHNEQSLRIAESQNLTWEVRDGILKHTGHAEPETHEGKIVRIVDRVAYINHDIDDAIRFRILRAEELPSAEIELLGPTGSKRIDRLVHDLVETSEREGDVRQSEEIGAAMLSLRAFMFERVYLGEGTKAEHARARDAIARIFEHLCEHPGDLAGEGETAQLITDYIAGMTDRYALSYAASL
jgi:dGTPase